MAPNCRTLVFRFLLCTLEMQPGVLSVRHAMIAVVGWLAFLNFANAQYPLYPSQAYPGGKETQRWHVPPPQTPSYYASATGPSRDVGYPTSLYGPAVHFHQQVIMPPPYLAFVPSAGIVPGQDGFSSTNPNLTADRSNAASNKKCTSCGTRSQSKNCASCGDSWWEKHIASKGPKGCYGSHFSMACGSFKSEMVFLFGSSRAYFGESCSPDSICPTPWDLLYGTGEIPDSPF